MHRLGVSSETPGFLCANSRFHRSKNGGSAGVSVTVVVMAQLTKRGAWYLFRTVVYALYTVLYIYIIHYTVSVYCLVAKNVNNGVQFFLKGQSNEIFDFFIIQTSLGH